MIGAWYALISSGRTAAVTINRISGLTTDTNSTAVAIAAARSVWASLSISPRDWIDERLDELLKTAWDDNPKVAQHFLDELGEQGAAPKP